MEQVIKLLEYFKVYQDKGLGDDIGRFGLWLNKELGAEKVVEVPPAYSVSENAAIGFLLGGLLGFGDVWTRLAFRDLPIQHFYDFGIIKFIEVMKAPTKKEVADKSLLEQSTCFEAIKRLTKHGILEEQVDTDDRRVNRVKLTAYGRKIASKATQQSFLLSDLLVGDLVEEEKSDLTRLLKKLDRFHEDLYRNTDKDKIINHYRL